MTTTNMIEILSSFVGSFGFAILFNIRGKRLIAAAFGGLVSWVLFIVLNGLIGNAVISYFFVAALISVYAEIMASLLKSPTTTFIITSLIPMIPGSSLYYTMVSAFNSNGEDFIQKALGTLELAAALALGIVVVTAFTRLFRRALSKEK